MPHCILTYFETSNFNKMLLNLVNHSFDIAGLYEPRRKKTGLRVPDQV